MGSPSKALNIPCEDVLLMTREANCHGNSPVSQGQSLAAGSFPTHLMRGVTTSSYGLREEGQRLRGAPESREKVIEEGIVV